MIPLTSAIALVLMPIQSLTDDNQDWYVQPVIELIDEELTLEDVEFEIRYRKELEAFDRARGAE